MTNPLEKISTTIVDTAPDGALVVADEIAQIVRKRNDEGKKAVIGFATGSTPTGVYRQLINIHHEQQFSFANMVTFNLDEYYPIEREHAESYFRRAKAGTQR